MLLAAAGAAHSPAPSHGTAWLGTTRQPSLVAEVLVDRWATAEGLAVERRGFSATPVARPSALAVSATAAAAAGLLRRSRRAQRRSGRRITSRASGSPEVVVLDEFQEEDEKEEGEGGEKISPFEPAEKGKIKSPFDGNGVAGSKKEKLPLTWENVQLVLDELRPYLQNDGGDCKISEIDGPIVLLELQGSCSSCSSSATTMKMGIERTLAERIPEISEVNAVMPNQEPITEKGIQDVLDSIRPFLSVSGGNIELDKYFDDKSHPTISLKMSGPPLKSMAVRMEIVNRMKRKFPLVEDVEINDAEADD
mmetsp:Transcript_120988/g.386505  ORF Transcript_120988/g.386505 Transcript_120988/m.386505 type:complete len:308 (-) Transcript_120988:159-1082(-)